MWKVKAILDKARADAAAVADDRSRQRIWQHAWRNVAGILLPHDPRRLSRDARPHRHF